MKKIIGLFMAVMAMAIMMSSCTLAGTPAGLIGKWAFESNSDGGIEIKADDTIDSWAGSGSVQMAEISKCTCDEITIKAPGGSVETTWKYELSCDTLKITTGSSSTTTFKRKY